MLRVHQVRYAVTLKRRTSWFGAEILADGDEVLEPGDVALGELAGVVVDPVDAVEAGGGHDDQGEDEESERGAHRADRRRFRKVFTGPLIGCFASA